MQIQGADDEKTELDIHEGGLPRTLQYAYAWCSMVVLWRFAVSYERGTAVMECRCRVPRA